MNLALHIASSYNKIDDQFVLFLPVMNFYTATCIHSFTFYTVITKQMNKIITAQTSWNCKLKKFRHVAILRRTFDAIVTEILLSTILQ